MDILYSKMLSMADMLTSLVQPLSDCHCWCVLALAVLLCSVFEEANMNEYIDAMARLMGLCGGF